MRNICRHRRLYDCHNYKRDVIVFSEYLKVCTAFASFCNAEPKDKVGDALFKCQNGLEKLFPNTYSICIYVPVNDHRLKLSYETQKDNSHKIRILQVKQEHSDTSVTYFYAGLLNQNVEKNAYLNNFLLNVLK